MQFDTSGLSWYWCCRLVDIELPQCHKYGNSQTRIRV
jgi:hypothetical protein